MRVLAINCSPRKSKGNTALILDPFLQGIREAGGDVELLQATALDIRPCRGKLECWFKQPGQCTIEDDMQPILDRLRKAQIWVFATGVYCDGPSGLMKTVMDRTLPLLQPNFKLRDGRIWQPLRKGVEGGKIVLVSSCAYWSLANFDLLVAQVKSFSSRLGREFAGALLRPHAFALPHMMWLARPTEHILDAARAAGHQLVEKGKMSPKSCKIVGSELMPERTYLRYLNTLARQSRSTVQRQRLDYDDSLKVRSKPHPFTFKRGADDRLNRMIVEAVSRMGGLGEGAEAEYQASLAALREDADAAARVVATAYQALPQEQFLDRWSLVHLLGELGTPSSLPLLDDIVRAPLPPEKSKVLHQFSTRAEEGVIRTAAIEAIRRIGKQKNGKALELLLQHTRHEIFSVRRAAVQSYLDVGGPDARKKLLSTLPKQEHYLLQVQRKDVRTVPQATILDRTGWLKPAPTPPPRADERKTVPKRNRGDAPQPRNKEQEDSPPARE